MTWIKRHRKSRRGGEGTALGHDAGIVHLSGCAMRAVKVIVAPKRRKPILRICLVWIIITIITSACFARW